MEINSTVAYVYCIAAVVSALILFFCAFVKYRISNRHTAEKYIIFAFIFAGLAAIFDCTYILRESEVVHFSSASNYILTIIYVIFASLAGTYWVVYSEKKQKSWFAKTKLRFALYSLPMFLLLLFVATTPFTKWYFYFEDGHYERGPLFVGISVFLIFYVFQTGIMALIKSFKKENYVERKEYRRLFIFAIMYFLIQVIQLILPTVFPYRSMGIMLVYLAFLIQNLQETIGNDPLTHMNNRFAAERYLGGMFNSKVEFEMGILDIDKFKSINDTFGHLEGDKALQCLSSVLLSFGNEGYFVSRMGGDEFVIINSNHAHSIIDIEDKINEKIKQVLKENNFEYTFTVSVGYAQKDNTISSIPDLIAIADEKLYERKNIKHTNR